MPKHPKQRVSKMAAPAKKDAAPKKGAAGPKTSPQKGKAYTVQGDTVTRTKPACPKCGPGTFMATHNGRVSCGKCGYTEFKK